MSISVVDIQFVSSGSCITMWFMEGRWEFVNIQCVKNTSVLNSVYLNTELFLFEHQWQVRSTIYQTCPHYFEFITNEHL